MEHDTFDNESDNDDTDDEEVPRTPRPPKNGAAPKKKAATSSKESERKKRELITMGKAKGFLTYDEVNEHMPENIVSSDQMDDWLSAFSGEGIEIVDSSSKLKVAEKGEGGADAEEEEEEEVEAKKEEPEEEEDADGYSKTNDPVRMYLRKMGSVSLLTREGEVEIAKRIEDGERRVLQVVLNSSVAIERDPRPRRQAAQAEDPRQGGRQGRRRRGRRVRRAVAHRARLQVIDKVRRLWKEQEKVVEKLDAKVSDARKKNTRRRSTTTSRRSWTRSRRCVSTRSRSTRSSLNLKELVERIEQANREIIDCESKSGLTLKEFKKTLREMRDSPLRQRAVAKKLGIRPDEIEEMSRVIQLAQKKIKKVEEEAKLSETCCARPRRDPGRRAHGREGQGRARRGQPAPRRRPSRRSTRTAACSSST